MKLNPYLIFSGHCKEALTFYKKCLGGEIVAMHTHEDSPLDLPAENN